MESLLIYSGCIIVLSFFIAITYKIPQEYPVLLRYILLTVWYVLLVIFGIAAIKEAYLFLTSGGI